MIPQDTQTPPAPSAAPSPPATTAEERHDPVAALVEPTGAAKQFGKRGDESPPEDALQDAMAFFCEEEEQPLAVRALKVNVGTTEEPKLIRVVMRGLEDREQKRISVQVENDRNVKRIKDETERRIVRQTENMVRTVAAALVEPDPAELVRATGNPDVGAILKRKFGHKPGIFTHLLGVVYELSGFDEDDVEEDAGNGSPA